MPVALGELGWLYAALAVVLGARFVSARAVLLRAPDRSHSRAQASFLFSLVYLAALFAAMGIDRALLG